jgi:ABC-type antimicrobial peptide transport system permease subunit
MTTEERLWGVQTLQSAHKATRTAFWFALVAAVLTATFSILAIGGIQTALAASIYSPWSLLDAAVFGAIAIGLYRHSRVAAVAGLVLYVLEIVANYMYVSFPASVYELAIPLAFTLAFLCGVKGAFSYHRLKRAAAQEQGNESKDTAKGDLP